MSKCEICGKELQRTPINVCNLNEFESHFASCLDADRFRKRKYK